MPLISDSFCLETQRLRLRPWKAEDLEPFAQLNADPEVMEHMPAMLERTESDLLATRIGERLLAEGYGLWVVEHLERDGFLGFVGLNRLADDMPCAPAVEVGWRLVRSAWGHGYATEAARAACADGFGRLDLDEVIAFTTPVNLRSQKVMERLGMIRDPEADFEHPRVPVGNPLRHHILYRLGRGGLR